MISFGDLVIGDIAKKNLDQVIRTNWVSEGPLVKEFEKKWGELFGYRHNISMSTGTDADINSCLVLYDLGAERGDEIICPALTFIATANAILLAGFKPKFVDIERDTLNIDPDLIEAAITPKTRAIIATHTMGKPCKMDYIRGLADKHDLFVIEDACEAHGAKFCDKFVGYWGDVATFSFYTAHMVVCGEGGMCSTQRSDVAGILRSTRSHGRRDGKKYFDFCRIGLNSKMTDLAAAIGLEGLAHYEATVIQRNKNKKLLLELLNDISDRIALPVQESYEVVAPHAFPIVLRSDDKEQLIALYDHMEQDGIECKTLFGSAPTQHEAFGFLNHRSGDFPEAEFVGRNGLHFGVHQYLGDTEMRHISSSLHRFFYGSY